MALPLPVSPNHRSARVRVRLAYEVEERPDRWLLDDDDMPEIPLHDAIIQLLSLILQAFAVRTGRSALVTSNLGCRWDPDDARVGVDPDVVFLEPAPPGGLLVTTLRVWEPGHAPPRVAVEVVSEHSGAKDYLDGPLRYARLGARELWVFDPLLLGPEDTGGPFKLQVWRRDDRNTMVRTYAGAGPARSDELDAWLVVTADGSLLRVADDPTGERLWPTPAETEAERTRVESERARVESERARVESERARDQRARADAAEAEIERLREELARRLL